MQIHGYNQHFDRFGKNPFNGESFRVFMAVEDDGTAAEEDTLRQGEVDKYLAPNVKRAKAIEGSILEELSEVVPSKRMTYPVEGNEKINDRWIEMLGKRTAIQNYTDWFSEYTEKVRKLNPDDPNWKEKIKNVYTSIDIILKFQEEEIDSVLLPGMTVSEETKSMIKSRSLGDFDTSKDNVLRDLTDMKIGLEKAGKESEKRIKEQMKYDFEMRVEWLKALWKDSPPNAYARQPELIQAQIKYLDDNMAEIDKIEIVIDGSYADYHRIARLLDKHESVYFEDMSIDEHHAKYSENNDGEILSVASLEAKLEHVRAVRSKKISAVQAQHKMNVNTTRVLLQNLRARVSKASDEEIQGRTDVIKNIDEQLESLNELGDLDAVTAKVLDYVAANDPDPANRKKNDGLALQIAALRESKDMDETQKEAALVFLDQALDKFENDLNGDLSGNLGLIQNQVKEMNEILDHPAPSGWGWSLSWVAPYDAIRGFEIMRDWGTRKLKRQSSYRVGQFGSKALYGLSKLPTPLRALNTLPNEFDKEMENSEQEEVNAYKEAYKNKDIWQIEALAYSTRNNDEFKACLLLLAENGRLRWDRRELLKQFNWFQSSVSFSDNMGHHLGDIGVFYEKLNQACGSIWDFDTFKELKTQNSSAYDSKKNEWEQSCHAWSDNPGLDVIIKGYLKDYIDAKAEGRNPNFDPLAYEKIIDYSFKQGKMGSEIKMYFLLQGIALGILPPDRGSVLTSIYSNDHPSLEYFSSSTARANKPTLEDIQEVAALDEDAYMNWFHTVVTFNKNTSERLDKTLTQGNRLDHDDLMAYLGYVGVQSTKSLLSKQASGFSLPQTGVLSGTVSMAHYLNNIAINHDLLKGSGVDDKAQLVRFVGSFVTYNGIIKNRMYKDNQNYFHLDGETLKQTPRAAGAYTYLSGEPMTVEDNLGFVEKHLTVLDQDFFSFLFDGTTSNADVPKLVDKLFQKNKAALQRMHPGKSVSARDMFGGSEVKTIDDLHENTTDYIAFLIDSGKGDVKTMINNIEAEQAGPFKKFRNKLAKFKDPANNAAAYEKIRFAREGEMAA